MSCPPAMIYGVIGCISVLVAAYITYKHQKNSIFGSLLKIAGVGKITMIHTICSLICGICGVLCIMSLLNLACDENMVIGWLFGFLCILSQIFGLYYIWKNQ